MTKLISLYLLFFLTLLPLQSATAADMFIKFDGIDGESSAPGHEGEIDIISWSWGVVYPRTINRGGKVNRLGAPGRGSITVSKKVDKTSPVLMESCTKGTSIEQALLTVETNDGSGIEYVTILMENLVITGVEVVDPERVTGPAGEEILTENVTLNFSKIKMDYNPMNPDGSSAGKVETTWKVEKGG